MTTIRKTKWFWAWQDEKEEAWLKELSLQGWHLTSAQPFGHYIFTGGEPKNYVYRLDFQASSKLDLGSYLKLFDDTGWEYIGDMMGWKYFRKLAQPGENPEIFTDNQSKIQKYQRLLGYLVIFFPIWFIVISNAFNRQTSGFFTFMTFVQILAFGLLLMWLFVFINIFRRISQLKRGNL